MKDGSQEAINCREGGVGETDKEAEGQQELLSAE